MGAIARELDYPDKGAQSRLDQVKEYVDQLEALLIQIRDNTGATSDDDVITQLETLRDDLVATLTASESARDSDATAAQDKLEQVRALLDGTLSVSVDSPTALRREDGHGATSTLPTRDNLNDFARLLKFQPLDSEEIRRDETTTDDYHGAAPDGTPEASTAWRVVRFYKDAAGNITRVRYRTGVAWTNRTVGW